MTSVRVAGLIFLSGAPGRIKCPVSPSSAMAWLLSIIILDLLNRVSFFRDSMLFMDKLSVIGPVWAVMSYLQLLWIIVLSSSYSSSSYKVLFGVGVGLVSQTVFTFTCYTFFAPDCQNQP